MRDVPEPTFPDCRLHTVIAKPGLSRRHQFPPRNGQEPDGVPFDDRAVAVRSGLIRHREAQDATPANEIRDKPLMFTLIFRYLFWSLTTLAPGSKGDPILPEQGVADMQTEN